LAPGKDDTTTPRGEIDCVPLPAELVLINEPVAVDDKLKDVPELFLA
jgi:hypothetical protein